LRAHGEQAGIEAFSRVYEKVDSQLDPAPRQAIKRRLETSEW